MRHLLTFVAVLVLGAIDWVVLADKFGGHAAGSRQHDTISEEEVVMAVEPGEPDEDQDVEARSPRVYYGDTIYQYDGKTVVINYSDIDPEFTSLSSSQIITYRDTTPVSRSRV